MKTQHIGLAIALLLSTSFVSIAQTTGQKIGENPTTKHPGAVLDLESTDKGVLFPRVALSNTTTWGLAGTQTKGMLIYNTKTTTDGFSGTTAYPVATGDGTGLYFWDGTGWAATAKTSGSDPTTDAWIDDPTNTQVKLGTLSNGTTARTDDKAFVAKDNGNVGIGLTNPAGILDIKGKMYVNNKQTIYNADALDNTNLTGSLFIGNGGTKLTTPDAQKGKYNSSLGIDALFENTSGFENTAIGAWALKMNKDGFDNTAIGTVSMRDNISGDHNTALGQSALKMLTTGDHNTALGSNAMLGGTTAITGGLNTAVGYQAMSKLTSGTQNTVLGSAPEAIANNRITTGSDNTFVGYNTGVGITTGGKNTIVGANVAGLPAALSNNIIFADGDGNQRIRVLDNGNTGMGTLTPKSRLDINGYAKLGSLDAPADALTTASDRAGMLRYNGSDKFLQYHDNAQWRTLKPIETVHDLKDGYNDPAYSNVGIGSAISKPFGSIASSDGTTSNPKGFGNSAFGYRTLLVNTTGSENTGVGINALFKNTTGSANTAIGSQALLSNTTGNYNVAIGQRSLSAHSTGTGNTAVGYQTGENNSVPYTPSTGSYNTYLGYAVGTNIVSGENNTIVGARIAYAYPDQGAALAGLSNNVIIADGSGNQRIRVLANGNTGIGTTTPQKSLHVNGSLQVTNELNVGGTAATEGSAGNAGQVLVSSGAGLAPTWSSALATADATNDAWVNDNANTMVKLGTLSDGTTTRVDNAAFVAKNDGKVGIGTVSPVAKLSVEDNTVATYVQMATLLAPSNTTVGNNTGLKLGVSNTSKNSAEARFNYQGDGSNNNRLDLSFHGVSPLMSILAGGNVGIGTTSPTAKLHIKPQSAADGGLRVESLSDSKSKQNNTITYGNSNSPMHVDDNGYVYKKYNPVMTSSTATTFDGSYVMGEGAAAAVNLVSLSDGSIVRFQMYAPNLTLGQEGIGANLYADITYGYGGGGFRVSTYGSETGGSAAGNSVNLVVSNGGHTITFDFAIGADLVLTNTTTTQNGPLAAYYINAGTARAVTLEIFQSFRSR